MGGQGGTDRKLTGPGGRGEGKDSALEGGGGHLGSWAGVWGLLWEPGNSASSLPWQQKG